MSLTVRKTLLLVCITALVSLITGLTALDSLAAGQETKRVLVLQSYHQGYTFSDNEMHGINDAFSKSGIRVEAYVTYMDLKRIPLTPQYFVKLKELLKEGYRGARFDAVLACDNDALEFLRKYRDELFPGVPVVFSGINDFDERMLDGRRDLTGTIENTDYASTISVALKLRPATKSIVVVTDNTTTGKAHRFSVEKIRTHFPQGLGFTYLSLADMTLDELAQKLSKLDSDSIVLLLQHFVDKNGTAYTIQESTSRLAKSSSVLVFVVNDSRMGLGVLGGHLVNGYSQGEAAAQMAVKILRGTDVKSIPVLMDSPNRYMFDYSVMQRFRIAESDLPQKSLLMNKPVSVLEKYKKELLFILAVFIILCGFLVYLLFEIRRRKRIEESLRENEAKYRAVTQSAKDAIITISGDGTIIGWNMSTVSMFGYMEAEVLGQQLDLIIPRQFRERHHEGIKRVQAGDEDRVIGKTVELVGLHKNGNEFPLELSLSQWEFRNSHFYTGIIRNITERKQAEEIIQEERSLSESIVNSLPGIFYLFDAQGKFLRWNRNFEIISGYSHKEILERHPSDFFADNEKEPLQQSMRDTFVNGEANVEAYFVPRNGVRTPFFFSGARIEINGQPHLVGMGVDITKRKQAEAELLHTLENLRRAVNTTIQVLISAVEVRDPYTAGHQLRSANLARAIAKEMGLPQEKIDGIRMAGSIHDIGKLSIPAEILSKPTRLSDIELSMIKEHAHKGFEMLKDVESPWPLAEIVYQHHERMDGSGYPRRLKGEEILIEARIITVSDVVEAMASHRPYRPGLGIDAALNEIETNRGILYDEAVTDACLRLFREKGFNLKGT